MKRKHHSSFRARSDSEASASSGSESDHGEGSERTCTLHSSTKTGTKHSNNEDTYIATFDVAASTKRKGSNTAALFAVFDGHGGGFCSKYLKENFLFHLMNQNLDLEAGVEEAEMKFCNGRKREDCTKSLSKVLIMLYHRLGKIGTILNIEKIIGKHMSFIST